MKKLFVLWAVCVCFSFKTSNADFEQDYVDTQQIESLIVKRLNEIRAQKELSVLTENTILKKAADDQARYISNKGSLSHSQPSKAKEKTRNRVEYYGGKMQGIGENTAYLKVFGRALFKGKEGQIDTVNINTVDRAVDYFVHAWMNSVPHKTNILYPDYSETGLKVIYNKQRKALYGVQVFAYPYKWKSSVDVFGFWC